MNALLFLIFCSKGMYFVVWPLFSMDAHHIAKYDNTCIWLHNFLCPSVFETVCESLFMAHDQIIVVIIMYKLYMLSLLLHLHYYNIYFYCCCLAVIKMMI